MKFEKSMQDLSAIVEKLEGGGLTLEESVKLYGKGAKLAADCKAELDRAKLTVSTYQAQKNDNQGDETHDKANV